MAANRLRRQLQAQRVVERNGYGIIPPVTPAAMGDARQYGVFGPAYAGAMQTKAASDDFTAPSYMQALFNQQQGERADYQRMLEAAQAGAMAEEGLKGYNNALTAQINKEEAGLIGTREVVLDPETGRAKLRYDPIFQAGSNEMSVNKTQADIRKANADANKSNYDAGLRTDPTVAAQRDTSPFQPQADPTYGLFNPAGTTAKDATDQFKAESERIDVTNPLKYSRTGGSGGGGAISIELSPSNIPGGAPLVKRTWKGKPGMAPPADFVDGGGGGAPATSPLQARIAAAIANGSTVAPAGKGVVIISRTGQSRKFDANGNPVQ